MSLLFSAATWQVWGCFQWVAKSLNQYICSGHADWNCLCSDLSWCKLELLVTPGGGGCGSEIPDLWVRYSYCGEAFLSVRSAPWWVKVSIVTWVVKISWGNPLLCCVFNVVWYVPLGVKVKAVVAQYLVGAWHMQALCGWPDGGFQRSSYLVLVISGQLAPADHRGAPGCHEQSGMEH